MGTRSASVGRGLAEVQTGVGTFIAFSTQPGNAALDGNGPNSPFTASLAKRVMEPGQNLTAIMIGVRKDVLAATSGRQVPWDHSALTSDFYFQPAALRGDQDGGLVEAGAPNRRGGLRNAAASGKQIVAELDALAAAQDWRELRDRLADVSPTSRDAHWNSLVEQAAVGELEPLTAPGGSADERLAALERYYPKFPSLKTSARFQELRTKIGLDAFTLCFKEWEKDQCLNDLERFVRTQPQSVQLAIGAAHLVGNKFKTARASRFYLVALNAPGGEDVCTDSELAEDLLFALRESPDDPDAQAARAITEQCVDAVKTAVAAEIARTVGPTYYLRNVCPILIQHQAVAGLKEKRCQAVISEAAAKKENSR
jgi:hypothetical protein